jgi:hypothetical protein
LSSPYRFATIENINKCISYYVYCIQICDRYILGLHPRTNGSSLRNIKLM